LNKRLKTKSKSRGIHIFHEIGILSPDFPKLSLPHLFWSSILVPVKNRKTDATFAVLGVDYPAKIFRR
jgi:hypothetical protein